MFNVSRHIVNSSSNSLPRRNKIFHYFDLLSGQINPNSPSEKVSPPLATASATKKMIFVAPLEFFLGILKQILVQQYLVSTNLCNQYISTELTNNAVELTDMLCFIMPLNVIFLYIYNSDGFLANQASDRY